VEDIDWRAPRGIDRAVFHEQAGWARVGLHAPSDRPKRLNQITMSVEAAAHDRAKYLLTIKRNERSPSREIAAHNQRNVHQKDRGRRLRSGATLRAEVIGNSRPILGDVGHLRLNVVNALWDG
jgi:hypothetical protein